MTQLRITRNTNLLMRGKKIHGNVLQQILRKRIYMAEFERNDVVYKAIHGPLTTRDTRTRVKQILKGRKNNNTRPVRREFPFIALITCGHCGCGMATELKKGK